MNSLIYHIINTSFSTYSLLLNVYLLTILTNKLFIMINLLSISISIVSCILAFHGLHRFLKGKTNNVL